jgi:hypothetical protein
MHIHTPTNTYPYSVTQLKRDNPQTSFPKDMTDAVLASWGVYPVQPTPQPQFDPITQRVVELPPIEVDDQWVQQWAVQALTPEEVAANQAAAAQALQDSIVSQTQDRLDNFARTRNYDGILSLCTYATSAVPKFQAEGQYGVNARDNTWATLYQILGEVQAGTRPIPSGFADIEPDLPALEWPA